MGPKTAELVDILAEAIDLLRMHGVTHWAKWLEEDKHLIESSDFRGIEHLLSAFGGMGSLSDLYICKDNGHSIEEKEADSVNDRLMKLNGLMYELADKIRRESNKQ